MSRFKGIFKSPHIQIALVTGFSIILMAYVSGKILPEPMDTIPLAIPPFFMVLYELLIGSFKNSRICKTWYWIVAILLSTSVIILIYLI